MTPVTILAVLTTSNEQIMYIAIGLSVEIPYDSEIDSNYDSRHAPSITFKQNSKHLCARGWYGVMSY